MTHHRILKPKIALAIVFTCLCPGMLSADVGFQDEILSRIQAKGDAAEFHLGGNILFGGHFITNLYQSNGHKPVWGESSTAVLRREIQDLKNDGLNPENYWFPSLDALIADQQRGSLGVSSAVDLDMLLSEVFIRAYYNLLVGKVDPERLDDHFNISVSLKRDDLLPGIIAHVEKGRVSEAFNNARPARKGHFWLKEALARYRGYEDAGGWPEVEGGKVLKPGDRDVRVSQVRARLAVTGDFAGRVGDPELFDPAVEAAVKAFQERHGLDIDGAVGAKTILAMNVPVQERIDQLRVNLERQRWYVHENHGEFVVADIAGFHVYLVRDDVVIWDARAQVGKGYRQTPVFKDMIRYIDFNPTWTIPPGILHRSILPNLKKDPDYLDKEGYLLLTQDGKKVDPKTVDWASIKTMPYIVRQPPGPDNALGLVKFMFPNKHMVYLHDTNHKEQFSRASRPFSSGCVRVERPFELAEKLLAGQGGWDRRKIDTVIESGITTRVNLEQPVRVVIAYSTAVARDGQVYFREDVYSRDSKVSKALDAPFRKRRRDR